VGDIPNITVGLNKFTPELFDRMGEAIAFAERNNFGDQLRGFKVFPSFWATITGFAWVNNTGTEEETRIRRFKYMWSGGGLSSGQPDDENFAPAINLAEIRREGQPQTYLGINVDRIKETGLRQMPYITSNEEIVDQNGNLTVGTSDSDFFTDGIGPTVRMYTAQIFDPDEANPDNDLGAAYAFTASPNFDGPCELP
jgi:hypothetical protein